MGLIAVAWAAPAAMHAALRGPQLLEVTKIVYVQNLWNLAEIDKTSQCRL